MVLVLAAMCGTAGATSMVDQAQYDGVNALVSWSAPLGQTFTPTADNLSGFRFWFTWNTGDTTFDFRVIHWADQVQVAQVTYLNTVAGGQNYVGLASPIPLIPGDKYGIVEYGSPWPFFQAWLGGPINPYLGGHPVIGGVEQTEGLWSVNDLWFQTYYDTDFVSSTVPEPLTMAGFFTAMGSLGMYIRKRQRPAA